MQKKKEIMGKFWYGTPKYWLQQRLEVSMATIVRYLYRKISGRKNDRLPDVKEYAIGTMLRAVKQDHEIDEYDKTLTGIWNGNGYYYPASLYFALWDEMLMFEKPIDTNAYWEALRQFTYVSKDFVEIFLEGSEEKIREFINKL